MRRARGSFGARGRNRRLRLDNLVCRGEWRRRLRRRARRVITSESHRPSSEDSRAEYELESDPLPRSETKWGDCSFPAPGVSGARNEWSRTTAPSASVVVSRGGLVRKPPSRDNDLTVKSVTCVFGTLVPRA